MAYIGINPEAYKGNVVGSGHCVSFVQLAARVPTTDHWKPGVKVRRALTLAKGTAIATFQNGKYQNRLNGDSHAAIYIRQDALGMYVLDQWRGQPVHERRITFRGAVGKPNNDGDAYYVIESETRELGCGVDHLSIEDAIAHARRNLGGADKEPYWGTMGSTNVGWVVGYQITPRKRWRLDFDPETLVHVNEENFDAPPSRQKVIHSVLPAAFDTDGGPVGSDRQVRLYWHKWTSRYGRQVR